MDQANQARTGDFMLGLQSEGYLERFLAKDALESAAKALHSRPRLDDAHRRPRQRGRVRERDLLERLVLGRDRARHGQCT